MLKPSRHCLNFLDAYVDDSGLHRERLETVLSSLGDCGEDDVGVKGGQRSCQSEAEVEMGRVEQFGSKLLFLSRATS